MTFRANQATTNEGVRGASFGNIPEDLTGHVSSYFDPAHKARAQARVDAVLAAEANALVAKRAYEKTHALPSNPDGEVDDNQRARAAAMSAMNAAGRRVSAARAALDGPQAKEDRADDRRQLRARLAAFPDRHAAIAPVVLPEHEAAVVHALALLAPIIPAMLAKVNEHARLDAEERQILAHLREPSDATRTSGINAEVVQMNANHDRYAEGIRQLRAVWNAAKATIDPNRNASRLMSEVDRDEPVTLDGAARATELLEALGSAVLASPPQKTSPRR